MRQHDSRGHHRASQWTTSGFIDTADPRKAQPMRLRLKVTIRPCLSGLGEGA
jgi:hypothetical protein